MWHRLTNPVRTGNSWSETFQSSGLEKFVSKLKRAAYATATGLSKKGYGLDSPIRESLDMRLRGASMRSEPTLALGRSANALESDGMAATVSIAKLVDAEISSSANQEKLRVSVTMVVLESMSSLRERQLLPYPLTFRLKRQRRCFVLVLPCSTRLGIPEQDPEISSQSRASEVWDIWGFNTRIGWGLSRWQWDEARTRSLSRSSWERSIISTPARVLRPKNCKN